MQHIKNYYTDYKELIEAFSEETIQKRFCFLYQGMKDYIIRIGGTEKLQVNERILMHAVAEYFEDIRKVKTIHGLDHTNEVKVHAYQAYWLLRRKPIQVLGDEDKDENIVFANEKFVLSYIMGYLMKEKETTPLIGDDLKVYRGFIDTLYYNLKFRRIEPQNLELMLLAFKTGETIATI